MSDSRRTKAVWFIATAMHFALLFLAAAANTNAAERTTELMRKTLALRGDTLRGGQLYAQACATCHGAKAQGRGGAAMPALAGQRAPYLLLQIIDFAELTRQAPEMHRVAALLGANPEQRWRDIAAYLASLPVNPRPETGDGLALDVGSGIYRDACQQCHGEEGEGDDAILSPALAGQHYSYLLLQMRSMAAEHRFGNIDTGLALMLDSLSAADMAAVADYISRLTQAPIAASNRIP